MEGDPSGREVVEGGGIDVLLEIVDVVLAVGDDTAAVDHAQVDEYLLADVCINLVMVVIVVIVVVVVLIEVEQY